MKAITVKYYGPTATRGARLVASDMDGNRASIPGDGDDRRHKRLDAAHALCLKMGWRGSVVCGEVKGATVFVFVCDMREAAEVGFADRAPMGKWEE